MNTRAPIESPHLRFPFLRYSEPRSAPANLFNTRMGMTTNRASYSFPKT